MILRAIVPWVIAFLKSRNRHADWWVGVTLGLISLPLIGGHGWLEAQSSSHLDGGAGFANATIEGAYMVALWVVWPALIGAAVGRPPWMPEPPKAKE